MTEDELKQEAEEWLRSTDNHLNEEKTHFLSESEYAERAYLAGAEPREKRIAELKATCNKWFEHLKNREEELLNELNNQNAKYNKQIEELEKENAELEDKLANADYQLEGRDLKIKELETRCNELFLQTCEQAELIEKMKNWCNCKNYQQCLIELAEQGKGMKPSECCVNCKKWEIK